MRHAAAAAALVLLGCASDKIDVAPAPEADQNRAALHTAVAALRAAHHAPAAFRSYADRILALRPGMDQTVAEEAELLSVTEAQIVMQQALAAGVAPETLALTVWPFGLAPPVTADVPGRPRADEWLVWVPRADEHAAAYLERLCGGVLALECKDLVPEGHAGVVGGLVVERFTKRARRAVSTCLTCNEPHWDQSVTAWEQMHRDLTSQTISLRRTYAPGRWPIAGDGATDVPTDLGSHTRIVEVDATDRAERVRYAMDDARRNGATRIALIARASAYPYPRRAYVLPVTAKLPVRAGEPVQVLCRALDGTVRRAKPTR